MNESSHRTTTPKLDDIDGLISELEVEVRHLGTLNEAPGKNRTTNNCTLHDGHCYTF